MTPRAYQIGVIYGPYSVPRIGAIYIKNEDIVTVDFYLKRSGTEGAFYAKVPHGEWTKLNESDMHNAQLEAISTLAREEKTFTITL